jgi:hypothetical protein
MNRNDPLEEGLEGSEERFVSEKDEARQERWEERVIKCLVQAHVGATAAASIIREMKNDLFEKTNSYHLTFDAFIAVFPKFPIWIVSRPIPFAHNHVAMVEMRTKKEHWFRRIYRESLANVPDYWDEKPIGVMFEMLNSGGQFNILHNHHTTMPNVELEGELRISFPCRKGSLALHLDTVDLYLHSIGWFGTGE